MQFAERFSDPKIVGSTMSQQLTWSHVVELLPLKDSLQRDFYAEMCRLGELERAHVCGQRSMGCFLSALASPESLPNWQSRNSERCAMKTASLPIWSSATLTSSISSGFTTAIASELGSRDAGRPRLLSIKFGPETAMFSSQSAYVLEPLQLLARTH